jgi:hypothetical protein
MKDMVAESFEEHTVARFALARCLTARGDEEKKIRFNVLKELVEHHIEEEESEMLPKVQRGIPAEELNRLGTRMQQMFERASEMGLDAIVTGPAKDLGAVNMGANGGAQRSLRIRSPNRQVRAGGAQRSSGQRASGQRGASGQRRSAMR